MFNTDFYIDSVQNAKKHIVKTFVTNDTIKTELDKLIDSQTAFAKSSVKAQLELAELFAKTTSNLFYAKTK